jgi:ribosome biogenesis protein NSA1
VLEGRLFSCNAKGALQTTRFTPGPRAFEGAGAGAGDGASSEAVLEAGGEVSRMRLSPVSGLFATGGRENDLCLWDVERRACLFRAKNVPVDSLEMRVPVWVTDFCFMPLESHGEGKMPPKSLSGAHPDVVVTCTGYSHVRMYDTRVRPRPVRDAFFGTATDLRQNNQSASSHHLNGIVAADAGSVVVCSAAGDVFKVDLATMKTAGRYKGFAGSVRSVDKHPDLPLIASVGLDRFVRVHHTETREMLSCVYVKQRLRAVLFAGEQGKPVKEAEQAKRKRKQRDAADEDTVTDMRADDLDDADANALPPSEPGGPRRRAAKAGRS